MSRFAHLRVGPSDETATSWVLSAAAGAFILPASLFSYFPAAAGWVPIVLTLVTVALVMLSGFSGSILWFVMAGCLTGGVALNGSGSEGFDIARYVVIGASLLVAMEGIRLAHLARRQGQILPGVYERVFANAALVVAVMGAATVISTVVARSRTFPAWLLLLAVLITGIAVLIWGRSVGRRAAPHSAAWQHGSNPMPPPPRVR